MVVVTTEGAMSSSDAEAVMNQVAQMADYEALREVANQLAGLLVARQRAATTDEQAQTWRAEHQVLRARLDQLQPGSPAVAEALQEWSQRLAQLRGSAA
jgi:hypothetical protein